MQFKGFFKTIEKHTPPVLGGFGVYSTLKFGLEAVGMIRPSITPFDTFSAILVGFQYLFEMDLDGKRYGFALEFENVQNPEGKISRMTCYLEEYFPDALRLVVSANRRNALRMIEILRSKLKERDRARWFVSDYEKAISLPFKKIWHQLNHPIGE